MQIQINRNGGTVFVDLESDIDHIARYTFQLWRRDPAGWQVVPDAVDPQSSNTRDPGYHRLLIDPQNLDGMALQVFVAVTSLVPAPQRLDVNLLVWQGPRDLSLGLRKLAGKGVYPINYHTPVPPGSEATFDAAWEFKLV